MGGGDFDSGAVTLQAGKLGPLELIQARKKFRKSAAIFGLVILALFLWGILSP